MSHSSSRGYFLSVPSALDPLPALFTQAVLQRKGVCCSSEEFNCLADRADEAIGQSLVLTNTLIQQLLLDIRQHLDSLFALTDSIVSRGLTTTSIIHHDIPPPISSHV